MKLHIFQSDKGDCLLLQSSDGKNVLCDGGMAQSMRRHVRGHLADLVGAQGVLDIVYVSHIDQDHISGVLQLLEDALDWRVFNHHSQNGDRSVRQPDSPRPPKILGLWHNAFRDQITKNRGDIEKLLAASIPVLFGTGIPAFARSGEDAQRIATSIPEALKVSRMCRPDLLDIEVNRLPGQTGTPKLLFFRDAPTTVSIGSLDFTIVGPTQKELRNLRKGWVNWLRGNRDRVKRIRAEMKRRVEAFSNGAFDSSPFDLRKWNGIPDVKGVTTPNVASLLFLVEENGKRVLFTGDSQQDVIIKGLELAGLLNGGGLHLDVLKVQHHGSENNMDADFCRRVSADHYVFCGNGEHGNPEPEVLDLIFQSRLGAPDRRALAADADARPFSFWFSTTSRHQKPGSEAQRNFAETERLVGQMVGAASGQMKAEFNSGDFITLTP